MTVELVSYHKAPDNAPWMHDRAAESYPTRNPFKYFDKDGFDLNDFEHGLYLINGIKVNECLNRRAAQYQWFHNPFGAAPGVNIDHSLFMIRYGYAGALRHQIEQWADDRPLLAKLLQIKPKWGLDIDIEYVFADGYVMDLLHIEEDFHDYDEFMTRKLYLETFVQELGRNFDVLAAHLRRRQNEWIGMTADDQNNYRARLFGFDGAYKTYKVI